MLIMLEAEDILSLTTPERLFGRTSVDQDFRELMKQWHPDTSSHPRAADVSKHIVHLRTEAKRLLKAGQWIDPAKPSATGGRSTVGRIVLTGSDGKDRAIRYRAIAPFELGAVYYGDGVAAYVVKHEHEFLYNTAVDTLSTLPFGDQKMRDAFTPLLPTVAATFQTKDEQRVLVLKKKPGTYRLSDVLRTFKNGKLPAEHAAWVTSCVLNLCCYFQWARVSHGDISAETVFIEPATHTAYLLGGWWYAATFGETMTFMSRRTYDLAPRDIVMSKIAADRTDLILVRALGREMVDEFTCPQPMLDFFRHPTTGSARDDYRVWMDHVLPASFGARRFVELKINDGDVFK